MNYGCFWWRTLVLLDGRVRFSRPKRTDSCFRKCVTRYHDGELQTGEGVCVDRCVFKYMGAVQRIGELLQEGQPMPAAGGAPSVQ